MRSTEVYEVATFYAHFDVVKEGETPPPPVTVRVCDSLSCALAGSEHLLGRIAEAARTRRACGARAVHGGVRSRAGLRGRPCAGARRRRCKSLPPRRRSRAHAARLSDADAVRCLREERRLSSCCKACTRRQAHARRPDQDRQRCRAARPRRRRISDRPQMVAGACRTRAAPVRGQLRRGRARHLQGPLLSRTRSASLHRRHADRRLGRRGRRHVSLYPRRISRDASCCCSRRSPRSRKPAFPPTPRSICAAAPALTSAAKSRR